MSRQSRWIYRDMLDVYYDTEAPLSLDLDVLCDAIGVESDDERKMVERLLRFKFEKTESGYQHAICEAVITDYHQKAETAKANGKLGGRPKKNTKEPQEKPSGFLSGSDPVSLAIPTLTGSEANQEPRTNNQYSKEEPPSLATAVEGDFLNPSDTGRICKAMKQCGISDVNPGNQTLRALLEAGATDDEFVGAATKAVGEGKKFAYALGIVVGERKRAAELADKIHRGALPAAETTYQRSMRERMQEVAPEAAKRDPNHAAFAAEFFNAIEVPVRTVERLG